MQYRMNVNGATIGAVTNRDHSYSKGQVIEAPHGEFRHLHPSEVTMLFPTPRFSFKKFVSMIIPNKFETR